MLHLVATAMAHPTPALLLGGRGRALPHTPPPLKLAVAKDQEEEEEEEDGIQKPIPDAAPYKNQDESDLFHTSDQYWREVTTVQLGMEASAGLVAGSHNRNELVLIRGHEDRKPLRAFNGQVCEICGDEIGRTADGDLFVACNECGFPVCRPCYEYERREGSQVCPQCKTRYKRLKGSPRVEGDEEEDDVDDLDHEFINLEEEEEKNQHQQLLLQHQYSNKHLTEAMLYGKMSYGRGGFVDDDGNVPQIPAIITGARSMPPSCEFPMPRHGHGDALNSSLHKRVHPYPMSEPGSAKWDEKREGEWKERMEEWKSMHGFRRGGDPDDDPDMSMTDEARQPLSRKVPIASSKINPYRLVIVIRLVVLGFFLRYRILNPVPDAVGLWLTSIICEIWFAISWILDQFPKWFPIDRETYLDRLSLRYEREGEPSRLAAVDIFVSTVDPLKEPPLVTANTVLSILAVDYPVDKVSCYVSDDGASMLTFESLSETAEFARRWVPFCKRFAIEPRAPEMYFSQKIDYLKDKVQPTFVKERRAMKREYEEFKVRINAQVAKAMKVPLEGWIMQDGTPWPGNNTRDHPGMIQVFLGHSGGHDADGNELPRLVYVSREKRPGFQHHKKAGAMNALIRVSAVLTNAPFMLNLDCDHYINNSKAIREAMCFLMDPQAGRKVCYVQFPQRFDGIDRHDRYANRNTVFFDINMKGLDGIQGPVYVGTGCVFRRRALYGYRPPRGPKRPRMVSCDCCPCFGGRRRKLDYAKQGAMEEEAMEAEAMASELNLESKFGQSPAFVTSTLMDEGGVPPSSSPAALLREAIHVISCGYEDKTEWGTELGWIYGSITEDILTGFKMHCRGWRSVYCVPAREAFKGSAPINLSDRLNQVLRWALGSVEIFFSRHSPVWYGYRGGHLKWLERLAYINTTVYPFTSLPLLAYCTLPAVCLLTGKFIMPTISTFASLFFIALFISIIATGILELRWSGVSIEEWWRNEQFWVIGGVSAHLFAVIQGLLKVLAGVDTNFTVTSKASGDEDDAFGELYAFKWTALLVPPTTLLVVNIIGVVAGVSDAISNGYQSWGPLFGKLFFAFWVIVHLYPFLKGLMGRQNRTPAIVLIWSVLLASIFSLLWVRIDPFVVKATGPDVRQCGINC